MSLLGRDFRLTPVEDELFEARHQAHLDRMAHDDDPAAQRRIDNLEAVAQLRPLPQREAGA